jgi:hypothetical protein
MQLNVRGLLLLLLLCCGCRAKAKELNEHPALHGMQRVSSNSGFFSVGVLNSMPLAGMKQVYICNHSKAGSHPSSL